MTPEPTPPYDPELALRTVRAAVSEAIDPSSTLSDAEVLEVLAFTMATLDNYLSSGGTAPEAWRP